MDERRIEGLERRDDGRASSGGDAEAFTPSDDALGVYWLDFSDSDNYTLVSSRYSAVVDKFGNGHDFGQAVAGSRPYQATINGVNALDLRTAEHLLSDAAVDMTSLSQCSVLFVAELDSVASTAVLWETSANQNNNPDAMVLFSNGGNSSLFHSVKQVDTNATRKQNWETGALSNATPMIFSATHQRSLSPNELACLVDGAVDGSLITAYDDTGAYTSSNYSHYIGARGGSSLLLNGRIGEIILTGAHLVDDLALYNNYLGYLSAKWGVSVATVL